MSQNKVSARHIEDYHSPAVSAVDVSRSTGIRGCKSDHRGCAWKGQNARPASPKTASRSRSSRSPFAASSDFQIPCSRCKRSATKQRRSQVPCTCESRITRVPADYLESPNDELDDSGRERLERRVIEDLDRPRQPLQSPTSKKFPTPIIGAKRMALSDETAEKIAEFIAIEIVPGSASKVLN